MFTRNRPRFCACPRCHSEEAAAVVLRCARGGVHGIVSLRDTPYGGCHVALVAWRLPPGKKGFHMHRSGFDLFGPECLCKHYNPTGVQHGPRNAPWAHAGDFGNVVVNRRGVARDSFIAWGFRVRDVLGRSLVIHEKEDDLGYGRHPKSPTTGNSGRRILWGSIVLY